MDLELLQLQCVNAAKDREIERLTSLLTGAEAHAPDASSEQQQGQQTNAHTQQQGDTPNKSTKRVLESCTELIDALSRQIRQAQSQIEDSTASPPQPHTRQPSNQPALPLSPFTPPQQQPLAHTTATNAQTATTTDATHADGQPSPSYARASAVGAAQPHSQADQPLNSADQQPRMNAHQLPHTKADQSLCTLAQATGMYSCISLEFAGQRGESMRVMKGALALGGPSSCLCRFFFPSLLPLSNSPTMLPACVLAPDRVFLPFRPSVAIPFFTFLNEVFSFLGPHCTPQSSENTAAAANRSSAPKQQSEDSSSFDVSADVQICQEGLFADVIAPHDLAYLSRLAKQLNVDALLERPFRGTVPWDWLRQCSGTQQSLVCHPASSPLTHPGFTSPDMHNGQPSPHSSFPSSNRQQESRGDPYPLQQQQQQETAGRPSMNMYAMMQRLRDADGQGS